MSVIDFDKNNLVDRNIDKYDISAIDAAYKLDMELTDFLGFLSADNLEYKTEQGEVYISRELFTRLLNKYNNHLDNKDELLDALRV